MTTPSPSPPSKRGTSPAAIARRQAHTQENAMNELIAALNLPATASQADSLKNFIRHSGGGVPELV